MSVEDHQTEMSSSETEGSVGPRLEERFRTLVEHIPGVATYLDRVLDDPAHSEPLYISPQIEDMFGYPVADWLGEGELWLQILHPDDRDRMIAADAEARRTLSPMSAEYRLVTRGGRLAWVSEKAAVVRDVATDELYWQGVMVDITERKRAEEALRASEMRFRTIFDAAAFGVVTVDIRGRIIEANPTLELMAGYEPGELAGVPLAALVDRGEHDELFKLGEVIDGAVDRCAVEHQLRRKDHSLLWCRTVMALVRDGEGDPNYGIGMLEDITNRKYVEEELMRRAVHDPLTGLPNRRLLEDRLANALARLARRPNSGVAVIFLDLDGFKEVNDTLGHQGGDELLAAVGQRLLRALRPSDTLARIGGDEFVAMLEDVGSLEDARRVTERIMGALSPPFLLGAREVSVTASAGISLGTDHRIRPELLIRDADAAMYTAKRNGRNRIEMANSGQA
ncbi:MAG TPA: diguanylate cyclase [Actinomycetota bacterium]|nr:diguanylate cyclase [Actinomycetota bacterium]